MGKEGGEEDALPLFETKEARFVGAYKVLAFTVFVGICLIWVYRLTHMPRAGEQGRWAWIGMFMAELCFGLYWILTQSCRFKVVYHYPFKERLSYRYKDQLPSVDIFICTADPKMEPPTLVINTIFSVMSYNYPPEKLSIYLSDDGASELTYYALLEASSFSKHWIPFCKKFNIQPRSPSAYFAQQIDVQDITYGQEWLAMKKLYKEMEDRIDSVVEMGKIPKETRDQHKGFLEWNSKVTKQDHQSIVQIIIDGRDKSVMDIDGGRLPTLVYMAREKRPQWPHNFKAGAMNAMIRVSSEISNAPFILNLDCDMYANDADTIREALCFFMDDKRGHEISFVQYPQNYDNIMTNDIYGCSFSVPSNIEFAGLDGYGAAPYCGTGCFHRRESLCGKAHSKDYKGEWNIKAKKNADKTIDELEKESKVLTNCIYEKDTQWGNKMGLIYGCTSEDVVTGLAIQCRGWKSIHHNPNRKAFLGVAPTTLDAALVQHKRWSEGMFQIFFSKYCPFIYGLGKIKLGAQMAYSIYLLFAPTSIPTLYYVIVPPLCLLHGISLFPQVKSLWFLPIAYVFVARNACGIAEALSCGDTLIAWWNSQRMWVFRRTTSYLFGFIDVVRWQLGLSKTTFTITTKVNTEDVLKRYEQEVIEFGSSTIVFTIIASLALLHLFSLIGGITKIVLELEFKLLEQLILQVILNLLLVMINIPVYQALFIRCDNGRLPSSILFKSFVLASLACLMPII
nr:cellulose synthase-like protein E6 isoform X1 [Quercus suber]POF22854.1 cellulose synthase-like protein e6 [Quercus suber]